MHADRPATLPRVLARAAQVFGDAPAIIEGAQQLSFRELECQALAASAAFISAGITPGDRVAL